MDILGRRGTRAKALRQRLRQRQPGEVIVDGCRLVDDLVRWRLPIEELYLTPQRADGERGQRWIAAAETSALVEDSVLSALAPTRSPQGVLAVIREPEHPPWDRTAGLALLLDGVQDPGNVGAIVRSATALGAATVLLTPGCAGPFHPAAVRGSAGTVLLLPIQRNVSVAEVSETTTHHNGQVWAADANGTTVDAWQPADPTVLILGAEGAGVSEAAMALATHRITIPLANEVESLNVAVAAALLVQGWRRFHS